MSAPRKPKSRLASGKISAELAARLDRSPPGEPFRSVVLLETPGIPPTSRRQSRAERTAAVQAVKDSARLALEVVDHILHDLGGRRLSAAPDALGSIRVETPPAGVYRLALLKEVRAVLEDQSIAPLPPSSR
jgi:hypothetical protein